MNDLIEKIAYELYLIREKRGEEGDQNIDWIKARGIVDHYANSDETNWVWRYRESDYQRWAGLYDKHKDNLLTP